MQPAVWAAQLASPAQTLATPTARLRRAPWPGNNSKLRNSASLSLPHGSIFVIGGAAPSGMRLDQEQVACQADGKVQAGHDLPSCSVGFPFPSGNRATATPPKKT